MPKSKRQAAADIKTLGTIMVVLGACQFKCQDTRKNPNLDKGDIFEIEESEYQTINRQQEILSFITSETIKPFKEMDKAIKFAAPLKAKLLADEKIEAAREADNAGDQLDHAYGLITIQGDKIDSLIRSVVKLQKRAQALEKGKAPPPVDADDSPPSASPGPVIGGDIVS